MLALFLMVGLFVGGNCGHVIGEDVLTEILGEMTSLKSKVANLEDRLTKTEVENHQLKAQCSGLQRHTRQTGETTFPESEVSFTASVSQHVKNMTRHQTIIFGNTRTNIGGYYNNTTGVFYVPVPGTYLFYVNILSEASNSIETELVVNGNAVMEIYSGSDRFHGAGSNMMALRLEHGDNVWVKVHAGYSTDMSVHCCWSTFTGVLLREVYNSGISVIG